MRWTLLFVCLLAAPASAQVYKCVVNGKTQYAERPCAPDAKKIQTWDGPEEQQRLRDAAQARAAAVAAMGEAVARVRRENQFTAPAPSRAAPAPSQPSKKEHCDGLLRAAKDAKDESNKWRYHQGLIDDAKRRQKEAEDAHFSDCYGSNF